MTVHARRLADVVALPRQEPHDVDLVARACAGEAWAHEAIYRRHVQRVARIARRLLRDAAEVDDVVQETFLLAFENVRSLAEPAALRGWLTRIAISRVHRRFRWRRRGEFVASLEEQAAEDASPELRTELALVDRALRDVSIKLRTAWVLRRVLGDTLDEVADACACSLATAKRRIAEVDARIARHVGGPK